MKKSMGKRIAERRKELGLSQDVVAKYVGVNRVSVSNWETDGKNGTSPKGANLIALAELLKCTPEWLLSGEDEALKTEIRESNAQWHAGFELWDGDTPLRDDEVALPFFREVELAAGNGSTFVQENGGCKLRFAKSTLKKSNVDPQHAACVTVSGNSMLPVLRHGTTVGVDTSKKSIIDGEMYAIDHDGMLRVKMLYRTPGGGVRIKSYNNDEFPDEFIQPDKMQEIKIIGWVFWWSVLNVWNN
ncbi:helix-turn-helix transcriptional regulator [Shewanella baltica]|uniref:helix-turn-helix transcriptional regulator n=1 Tax=Shewanella TaxID=22 RepID=UPI00217CCF8D|nr:MULTISPECIES: helix-turn-helix transcriptional regulator [Shewanella]MCS6126655.1 helix-turn-helix transcriptional regulator [Shewanella baltica]MCS6138728.1 helix-turn-helix transcriptional regulator [Shewanella baltica]MCS6144917.1 helix-turn-helix transcriptional regulator [Shewanella baltica]MCS6169447.1 helix-turn-helix transcriptional regulator [Shewanella baltica]MCS6186671.1 helix-turn-helix transcriptional regulator [Shewanella baltica]